MFSKISAKWSSKKEEGLPLERDVLNALSVVMDPDLNKDIVSLGFVKDLKIEKKALSLTLELTTAACPVKESLKKQVEEILLGFEGVEKAQVELTYRTRPSRPQGLKNKNGDDAALFHLKDVKNVIAVASGKGGVGKSTSTVYLAYALKRAGCRVGILDADVYGPSLSIMMRPEAPSSSDGQNIIPPEVQGIKVISPAMFASPDKAAALRGPMAGRFIQQLLSQTVWGDLDYLLIDYPPGTGDIQLSLSQAAPLTGAVIVTTPQQIALADVKRAVSLFETVKIPVIGLIETMSGFICDGCDKRHELFRSGGGERFAETHGLPLLGRIPMDPKMMLRMDEGQISEMLDHDKATDTLTQGEQAYIGAAGAMASQLSILAVQSHEALFDFAIDWKSASSFNEASHHA